MDVERLYLRAGQLALAGRAEEAKQAYLAVIASAPTHFGALNDLGALLHNTDYRSAARLAYAEAVKHHPDNPMGRINLANALLANGEIDAARMHFDAALRLAPEHPDAHQGLANLLQDQGQSDDAERHRQLSYRARGITTLPHRGQGDGYRVLLLVSAVGGNVPTRFLMDDTVFAVSVMVVEAHRADQPLPRHDLVFNAVGDPDLAGSALKAVETVLARTKARVINPPARISDTGRASIARRLSGIDGVRAPSVNLTPRDRLQETAAGMSYPLLLRSPGYHTGRHFKRVEQAGQLSSAVETLPGDELLLIEYLDARDARGRWLKFRVMIIDGQIFPMHLAISNDWKVHYFTADMLDQSAHCAAEEAFLKDMPGVLGAKAMAALGEIAARLGLDYGGVDFGLGQDGEVLLFEANATMVVNPPDADPRWDYRRGAVSRILDATRAMLLSRAERHSRPPLPMDR